MSTARSCGSPCAAADAARIHSDRETARQECRPHLREDERRGRACRSAQTELWSPDSPTLYDLDVALKSGDCGEELLRHAQGRSTRKDAAGVNRIFLNDQPLFSDRPARPGLVARRALHRAHRRSPASSTSRALKKMGFNMARKHVKVEPARWYYWCDKLGFLVWQDMPSAMTRSHAEQRPQGNRRGRAFPAEHAAGCERELKSAGARIWATRRASWCGCRTTKAGASTTPTTSCSW